MLIAGLSRPARCRCGIALGSQVEVTGRNGAWPEGLLVKVRTAAISLPLGR